jgi:hypothetical protein
MTAQCSKSAEEILAVEVKGGQEAVAAPAGVIRTSGPHDESR